MSSKIRLDLLFVSILSLPYALGTIYFWEVPNLDAVEEIDLPGTDLIQIEITSQTPTQIEAEVTIDPTYPPQSLDTLRVKSHGQEYDVKPTQPPQIQIITNSPILVK